MQQAIAAPIFSRPLHEAIFWRGLFVNHYGAIEQSVTELLICCLSDPGFRHLGKVPGSWPEKLRRLGQILEQPNDLEPHGSALKYQLSTISIIELHRHLLVHGAMTMPDEQAFPDTVHFVMHDAWKRCRNELSLSLDDLRYLAQELGGHSFLVAQMVAAALEAGSFPRIKMGAATVVKPVRREL